MTRAINGILAAGVAVNKNSLRDLWLKEVAFCGTSAEFAAATIGVGKFAIIDGEIFVLSTDNRYTAADRSVRISADGLKFVEAVNPNTDMSGNLILNSSARWFQRALNGALGVNTTKILENFDVTITAPSSNSSFARSVNNTNHVPHSVSGANAITLTLNGLTNGHTANTLVNWRIPAEDLILASGRQFTFSVFANSTFAAPTIRVKQCTAENNFASTTTILTGAQTLAANTLGQLTVTFTPTNNLGILIEVEFPTVGVNGTVSVACPQLHPGNSPRRYILPDLGAEIMRCQRYLTASFAQRAFPAANDYSRTDILPTGTIQLLPSVAFPIAMARTPTLGFHGSTGASNFINVNGTDYGGSGVVFSNLRGFTPQIPSTNFASGPVLVRYSWLADATF